MPALPGLVHSHFFRFVPGFVFKESSGLNELPGLFQVCFLIAFNSKGLTRFDLGLF